MQTINELCDAKATQISRFIPRHQSEDEKMAKEISIRNFKMLLAQVQPDITSVECENLIHFLDPDSTGFIDQTKFEAGCTASKD